MLAVQPGTQWPTLPFRVTSVCFVVSGDPNAASWDAAQRTGAPYGAWIVDRAWRLIGPIVPLILVRAALAFVLRHCGARRELIRHGSMPALVPARLLVVYLFVMHVVPVTRAAGPGDATLPARATALPSAR